MLATNVAETSLTVPGIKYVIDPGTARISRYSYRTKVQRLPIEPISQASANQRKGRCGRVSEGICIRLYSEDDFLSRPEFTDPGDSAYQPGLGYFADDRAGAGRYRCVPVCRSTG
ncbi:helicase-related protein [Escherichia coli]